MNLKSRLDRVAEQFGADIDDEPIILRVYPPGESPPPDTSPPRRHRRLGSYVISIIPPPPPEAHDAPG